MTGLHIYIYNRSFLSQKFLLFIDWSSYIYRSFLSQNFLFFIDWPSCIYNRSLLSQKNSSCLLTALHIYDRSFLSQKIPFVYWLAFSSVKRISSCLLTGLHVYIMGPSSVLIYGDHSMNNRNFFWLSPFCSLFFIGQRKICYLCLTFAVFSFCS